MYTLTGPLPSPAKDHCGARKAGPSPNFGTRALGQHRPVLGSIGETGTTHGIIPQSGLFHINIWLICC